MHSLHESTIAPPLTPRVLIVCIGNDLVGDDAAGCEVYRALNNEDLPENISLLNLGVGGISLLDHLNGTYSTLIIVDAVRFGGTPGTVHRNTLASLPPTHHGAVSVHGLGIRELIDAGMILYPERMPRNIVCVGIEGTNFNECGVPLSVPVQEAIGKAVDVIRDTLAIR